MKAKSFHCSKTGIVQPIAAAIGTNLQCVCDKMPPAYPSDGEKVVFVGIEMKGKLPDPVFQFVRDLTPARTKGVAFYVINGTGTSDGLEGAIKTLKDKGIEVYGEPYCITVKSGLFKKGELTQAQIDSALAWAKDLVKNF